MFSRLAAVCTWLAWTKIVPLLLLIAVTALAAPAHAISIEDFFDPLKGFSSDVRHGAERTALTTEAYRNLKAGHAARAACIEEELIPKGRWDASGFDGLQAHLVEARDSGDKRLSVEDLIINAENVACPVENPEQYPSRVFSATSVREFYAKFPTGSDKVQISEHCFFNSGPENGARGLSITRAMYNGQACGQQNGKRRLHCSSGVSTGDREIGERRNSRKTDDG